MSLDKSQPTLPCTSHCPLFLCPSFPSLITFTTSIKRNHHSKIGIVTLTPTEWASIQGRKCLLMLFRCVAWQASREAQKKDIRVLLPRRCILSFLIAHKHLSLENIPPGGSIHGIHCMFFPKIVSSVEIFRFNPPRQKVSTTLPNKEPENALDLELKFTLYLDKVL